MTGNKKAVALENLVVELTLIAIATANIKHHHKARLDELLGDLGRAGVEMPKPPRTNEDGTPYIKSEL